MTSVLARTFVEPDAIVSPEAPFTCALEFPLRCAADVALFVLTRAFEESDIRVSPESPFRWALEFPLRWAEDEEDRLEPRVLMWL